MPFWAAHDATLDVVLARCYMRTAATLIHLAPGSAPGTDRRPWSGLGSVETDTSRF